MKRFFITLLSGFVTLAAMAQTITITFTANTNTNNNGYNRNRGYQVVLDGTSYYSNSTNTNTSTSSTTDGVIVLSNQQLGSHTIALYRQRNNNDSYNNGTNTTPNGNAIYSKTFELRQGYDMDIAVSANGQATFTEKRVRNQGRRGNNSGYTNMTPMPDEAFNLLTQSVRGKWLQSAKLTTERDAFQNASNYFTTGQVRQLLLLISGETNRVAMAKLAYPRVTDPASFTQLYDVFNSTYSRNDMDVFIRNNSNNNNTNDNGNRGNNNGYRSPMADYQFSQLIQTINSQYNQTGKYSTISGAFNNSSNYFTTYQVRQLLSLVNGESDRLALAKQSYLRVSDPANFSTLYDLFNNQYSRSDLNNYVVQNGGNSSSNYNYNSRTPMADATFSQVLQKVSNHFLPWDKVKDAKEVFSNNSYYFTTSQIRQILGVIASENDKLDIAKLAWSRVTDPNYFNQLLDMFSNQSNRNDLSAYIQAHPF
jgi:hypothetical protein